MFESWDEYITSEGERWTVNVFCKKFDRNEHFSPSELSSASESIQPVLIIWVGLNSN